MTDYCLFTIEHPKASRIYIRGIADITEPIDEYDKIVKFNGTETSALPQNPYNKGDKDFDLFNELLSSIKIHFEDICDDLVFAKKYSHKNEWDNHHATDDYILNMEKVII